MSPFRHLFLCAVVALSLQAACAPTPMAPSFPEHHAPTYSEALALILQPQHTDERSIAVAVNASRDALIAWDLDHGPLWEVPAQVERAPIVAGQYVVVQEQGDVVVRDLTTGTRRTRVRQGAAPVGAAGYGAWVFVTSVELSEDGEVRDSVLSALYDGQLRWERGLVGGVGVPAAANGYVVVPWATQRVSLLDAASGEERTRVRVRRAAVGHAFVDREAMFLGQHGVFRVTEHLEDARIGGPNFYRPLGRSVPGQPDFMPDGYAPRPDLDSALNRLRYDWRIQLSDTKEVSLVHDTLYLHAYRLLFALGAERDEVRGVFQAEADIVGSGVEDDAVYVADAAGGLWRLSHDAQPRARADLGQPLSVVTFRPKHVAPRAPAPSTDVDPGPWRAVAPSDTNLYAQLRAVADLSDARLAQVRAFAATHMGRFEGSEVTGALVDLCVGSASPAPLARAACEQVARRKRGGRYVLNALSRRASFVAGIEAPPVGALARAAMGMKLRKAGPLLASHISDPATRPHDLPDAFAALAALHYKPARRDVEQFLRLHHVVAADSELRPALLAAARALVTLGAKSDQRFLQEIADDGLTDLAVRSDMEIALRGEPEEPAHSPAPPPAVTKPEPAAKPDPRPEYLTYEAVDRVLRPHRRKLRGCLRRSEPAASTARVAMVVDAQGRVEKVVVTPARVQACVQPIVEAQRFGATRKGRQQLTFELGAAPERAGRKPKHRRRRPHPSRKVGKGGGGPRRLAPLQAL